MELARALFLSVALATHAAVGYAVVRGFTDADPRIGLAFGVLPDADLLFPTGWGWPLVHRGLTHTPLFAAALVAGAVVARRDRSTALAVGLAIGSHLVIDSLSPAGIAWTFPFEATWSPGLAVHGPVVTAVLWSVAVGILAWRTDDPFR